MPFGAQQFFLQQGQALVQGLVFGLQVAVGGGGAGRLAADHGRRLGGLGVAFVVCGGGWCGGLGLRQQGGGLAGHEGVAQRGVVGFGLAQQHKALGGQQVDQGLVAGVGQRGGAVGGVDVGGFAGAGADHAGVGQQGAGAAQQLGRGQAVDEQPVAWNSGGLGLGGGVAVQLHDLVERLCAAGVGAQGGELGPPGFELVGWQQAVFLRVAGAVIGVGGGGGGQGGVQHLPVLAVGGGLLGPSQAVFVGVDEQGAGQFGPVAPFGQFAHALANAHMHHALRGVEGAQGLQQVGQRADGRGSEWGHGGHALALRWVVRLGARAVVGAATGAVKRAVLVTGLVLLRGGVLATDFSGGGV